MKNTIKKTISVTYTHKGWFLFCPIYLNNVETDAPTVEPRHWIFTWLMHFGDVLLDMYASVGQIFNPDFSVPFPLYIKKLKKPITKIYEVEE